MSHVEFTTTTLDIYMINKMIIKNLFRNLKMPLNIKIIKKNENLYYFRKYFPYTLGKARS